MRPNSYYKRWYEEISPIRIDKPARHACGHCCSCHYWKMYYTEVTDDYRFLNHVDSAWEGVCHRYPKAHNKFYTEFCGEYKFWED